MHHCLKCGAIGHYYDECRTDQMSCQALAQAMRGETAEERHRRWAEGLRGDLRSAGQRGKEER